jgi:hypothetical protein
MRQQVMKTGFRFKASGPELDQQVRQLRKQVALANALRRYEESDTNQWGTRSVYRVEVYYRLGKNNPHCELYPRARNGYRRAFRVKREHAQYASVWVREANIWKH